MNLDIILPFLSSSSFLFSLIFFFQGPNTFFLCATCEQRTPERSSLSPDMLNLWLTWRWKVYEIYISIYVTNEQHCDTTCKIVKKRLFQFVELVEQSVETCL